MASTSELIIELAQFRSEIQNARGPNPEFGEFDDRLLRTSTVLHNSETLTSEVATSILETIDVLVDKNMIGRRPWEGHWEPFFAKCMQDARRLLLVFVLCPNSTAFYPQGYCNRFLDAFTHMDRHDKDAEKTKSGLSPHFSHLAGISAEMFSLTADSEARVVREFLDHPDDAVFQHLLTGHAKSRKSEALRVLREHLDDDEDWVRTLSSELITTFFPNETLAE